MKCRRGGFWGNSRSKLHLRAGMPEGHAPLEWNSIPTWHSGRGNEFARNFVRPLEPTPRAETVVLGLRSRPLRPIASQLACMKMQVRSASLEKPHLRAGVRQRHAPHNLPVGLLEWIPDAPQDPGGSRSCSDSERRRSCLFGGVWQSAAGSVAMNPASRVLEIDRNNQCKGEKTWMS
jgi:hypothetical protein